MTDVLVYFDESGDKGYLRKKPGPNQFCLLAGIAFPERNKNSLKQVLEEILSEIDEDGIDKCHAYEIFAEGKNQDLKQRVFNFILNEPELLIFHSAIPSKGLYQYRKFIDDLIEDLRKSRRNTHIKYSGENNPKKEDIYHQVLLPFLMKIDEMCRIEGSEAMLLTDKIDSRKLKKSRELITMLSRNKKIEKQTGYDTRKDEVVEGSVITSVEGFDAAINSIKGFETVPKKEPFCLMADIVTNSIYRHLNWKREQDEAINLNGEEIFEDFELKEKIAFLDDNSMIDKLYNSGIEISDGCKEYRESN
jgi:hypothetical protein